MKIIKPDSVEIKKLRVDVQESINRTHTLEAKLEKTLCDHHDIHVGAIVVGTNKNSNTFGRKFAVTIVDFHYSSIWVSGKAFKKDGNLSNATRNLFDHWEKENASE